MLSLVRCESSVSVRLAAGLGDRFEQRDRAIDRLDAVALGARSPAPARPARSCCGLSCRPRLSPRFYQAAQGNSGGAAQVKRYMRWRTLISPI